MLEIPEKFRELAAREREAITDLQVLLGRLGADDEHVADVRTALNDLGGLFMIVVAGEFNAGKSAFINALLDQLLDALVLGLAHHRAKPGILISRVAGNGLGNLFGGVEGRATAVFDDANV